MEKNSGEEQQAERRCDHEAGGDEVPERRWPDTVRARHDDGADDIGRPGNGAKVSGGSIRGEPSGSGSGQLPPASPGRAGLRRPVLFTNATQAPKKELRGSGSSIG